MQSPKLSATLVERLNFADAAELVDVVVELAAAPLPHGAMARAERVAAAQDAFGAASTRLEQAIESVGGEVVHAAWINQTVQARLPAGAVPSLLNLDQVRLLDVPHPVSADWG